MAKAEGLLDKDIISVISAKDKNIDSYKVKYNLIFHTVDIDFRIQLLKSIEWYRNYEETYGDFIVAKFDIPIGTFIYEFYKYKDNLEMTLEKENKKEKILIRYKAILINNTDIPYNSEYFRMSKDDLNKRGLINLNVQLVDRAVELLRTIPVSGIYKYGNIKNVIQSVIDGSINKIKIDNNAMKIKIDVVEPDNKTTYKHIDIPTGTKLLKLPTFLQDGNHGVYNSGIGTYFQYYGPKLDSTIFVYPLYSTQYFDKASKKLIFFKTSTDKFNSVECSYFQDGDILKLIAGGGTKVFGQNDNGLMDKGNAVVYSKPDANMQKNSMVSGGKVRNIQSNSVTGQKIKTRKDNNSNTRYSGNTSNPYKLRSEVMDDNKYVYQIPWNFSNQDLIYPGMPVMLVTEHEEKIKKLYGCVRLVYTKYTSNKFYTNSVVAINVSEKNN